jgi:hypothetical protein
VSACCLEDAVQSGVGCLMKSYKAFLFLILLACVSLDSCSGLPKGNGGGGGGGGGGTAKVSLILVADTTPASLGLVSFRVTINGITLTSSTGAKTNFTPNNGNGMVVDLVRLQSDSAFLGTVPSVPTGTNSSITVAFSDPQIAFFNGTGAAITSVTPQCPANAVCTASFSASVGAPVITSSQAIRGNMGLGIDFNLSNALVLTGTTLNVSFINSGSTNVISSFTLPRQPTNLATGQLDLIEDITGAVSITNNAVTITPATAAGRGTITATANSSTVLDADPSGTLCKTPTPGSISTCVSNNQVASMDAVLNSDGTLTVQEIEPLAATLKDTVEGTVVFINPSNQTQFDLITTDIIPAASNSLIGSLSIGDPLTVNLANNPNPFLVDSKGLPVASQFATSFGTFANAVNTTALHLGQTVAVHVTAFTAASGTTPASATVDTVTLRWSRLVATPTGASSPSIFNITALPGHFGFTQASVFGVAIFTGTPGTKGVTNLDGIASGSPPAASPPVAIRALFIEDPGNTLNPAFFAAKVRQH